MQNWKGFEIVVEIILTLTGYSFCIMHVNEMNQDNLTEICLPFSLSPTKTVRK